MPIEEHDPEAVGVQRPAEHFDKEFDPYENFSTPELYGDANCTTCHGRGRLDVPNPPGYKGPAGVRLCRCVLIKEVVANLERGRRGLSKARKVPKSPLMTRTRDNIRIAADVSWFEAHLRHVALRQSPRWDFRVVTDADLVQAWLATAAAKGMEIFDADVRRELEMRSLTYMTLSDIAKSATLLIIRLGIKSAPNKEMPNVLLETVLTRMHEGLATWIWEEPNNRLAQGHRCWSEQVEYEVGDWEQFVGTDADLEREIATKPLDRTKLAQERVRLNPTPTVAPPRPTSPPPLPPLEEVVRPPRPEPTEFVSGGYDVGLAMSQIGEPSDNPKKKKYGNSRNSRR